jgi:hypothetical protein
MEKQTMERRDFLKRMGSIFLGVLFIPLARLFHTKDSSSSKQTSTREAMHYTSGDNLAG